jgi:hypothetical protein
MEASQKKCDVTIQFLVGGLVIHFAGIFHLSFSFQKYSGISCLCNGEKIFSFFGGKYDPKKFLCKYPYPQKALP